MSGEDDTPYRKPYFKNDPPLRDTYTKLLEEKFRRTDEKFQMQAEKLIEDVRRIE